VVIDASGVKRGISEATGAMGGFGNTMMGIGDSMGAAGKNLTKKVTLPMIGVVAAASKMAGDFEAELNVMELAARDSGTVKEDLRAVALAVGADSDLVGISGAEAAVAMTNLYKAGLTTNDMLGDYQAYLEGSTELTGALRAAIDLAAASDLDLAQASEVVSVAMATFEMDASQAIRIADSFVQTADASVAEVGDLAAAFVNVGPNAASFGWSIEEVNTALAMLSERGITGAEAGTQLNSMIAHMTSGTNKVVEEMNKYGISLYDAEGNGKSMMEVLRNLDEALGENATATLTAGGATEAQAKEMEGYSKKISTAQTNIELYTEGVKGASYSEEKRAEKIAELNTEIDFYTRKQDELLATIPALTRETVDLTQKTRDYAVQTIAGTYGKKAMNILLAEGTEGAEAMAGSIANAATATEVGAARTKGFNAAMETLMGVVETFMITVGTPLIEDFLTPLAQKLSDAMGWLMKQDDGWVKWALGIGGVLALAGPLLMGLGAMASGIGVLVSIFGALGGVIATVAGAIVAALGPVLLIVAAVAAVAGLLYLAWETNFLGIRDILETVWDALTQIFAEIQAIFTNFMSFLKGEITFEEFKEKFSAAIANIGEIWSKGWENIKRFAAQIWPAIQELIGNTLEAIKTIIIEKVAEFIAPLVGGMDEARQVVTDAWQNVAEFLADVWEDIKIAAGEAWEALKTLVGEAVEGLRTIVSTVLLALSGDWSGAWDTIKGTVAGVWESIVGAVSTAVDKVVEVVTVAWDAIKGVWAKLKGEEEGVITDPEQAAEQAAIWQQMVNDLSLAWGTMQTTVVRIANEMATFLDGWGVRVQNAVVSAIATMKDEVVRLVQEMAASVRSTLNGLEKSARSAGEAIGQALADGLRSQVGEVRAAAEALADAVDSYLPGSDARVGPLSDLMASGRALPETLARGIDTGLGTLVRAAQEMAASVAMQGGGMAPMMPAMAAAGAAGRTDNASYGTQVTAPVTVYATVTNEVDVERLAHRIADVQEWRRRG